MVYKNFFLRLIFSLIFIIIYLCTSYINFTLIFYPIILIYILILVEIYFNFKKFRFLPIIYTLISLFFFLNIDLNKTNIVIFNIFIFTVISLDIFSYIIGKLFGKKKLIEISPNKTLEGFLGGVIISLSSSIVFAYVLNINLNFKIFTFISFIILFAYIGDILESFFKRKNNLKNSSDFIPGHGGVFDRFDSFVFSIIFYSISINYII